MMAVGTLTLAWRRLLAQPGRSLATACGVAAAAALACLALHLSAAGTAVTSAGASEDLIAMQRGRTCPTTSRLPLEPVAALRRLPGVDWVLPQAVVVSDCSVSFDAITFRGVAPEDLSRHRGDRLRIGQEAWSAWRKDPGAALVGSQVAEARGLQPGQTADLAGWTLRIAGIIQSDSMQDRAAVWVHRQALDARSPSLAGSMTLAEIGLQSGARPTAVASAVDGLFGGLSSTDPRSMAIARLLGDLPRLLRSSSIVALAAVAVSLALLAAAAVLAARQAARDLGILHALGHPARRIGGVVLAEGVLIGLVGGLLGAGLALAVIERLALAVSTESVSVLVELQPLLVVAVVVAAVLLALLAGLPAAWRAMHSGPRQVLEGGG